MKRTIVSLIALLIVSACACSSVSPYPSCPAGSEPCGSGCMLAGNVCCGDAGSCAPGLACGPGNTCVNPHPANPCEGCLIQGKECCTNNTDGVVDCAPLGAACCGNHRYCPSGYVC